MAEIDVNKMTEAIKLDLNYLAEHGKEFEGNFICKVFDLNFSKENGEPSEFIKALDQWLEAIVPINPESTESWRKFALNIKRKNNRLNAETLSAISSKLQDSEMKYELYYSKDDSFIPNVRISLVADQPLLKKDGRRRENEEASEPTANLLPCSNQKITDSELAGPENENIVGKDDGTEEAKKSTGTELGQTYKFVKVKGLVSPYLGPEDMDRFHQTRDQRREKIVIFEPYPGFNSHRNPYHTRGALERNLRHSGYAFQGNSYSLREIVSSLHDIRNSLPEKKTTPNYLDPCGP